MNVQSMKFITFSRLLGITGLLLLIACAQRAPNPEPFARDLVWPAAPETPRIQFLYALSQPKDINIRPSLFRRMVRALRGSDMSDIRSPYGLTGSALGQLYVVDNFYQAVHVFDTDNNQYFRLPKKNRKDFQNPVDVASGTGGRIFVSDSVAGRVHVFSDQGRKYSGSFGAERMQRPTGMSINNLTGELLVLDTLASRILVYDEWSLQFKRSVGGEDGASENLPVFHYPTNIAVAGDGRVYVTDSLNFRIQVLSSDLNLIGSFGAVGDSPGNFSRPKGVATDSDGHVYVIDALFDNVQIFDDHGELLLAFGGPGSEPGQFWLPNAIFIDSDDRIYISDSYNKRVQVFQYLPALEILE